MYNWHHWIGFILLSISICSLYFSDVYLFFYCISKCAAIFRWIKIWGTQFGAARCTRATAPQGHCALGPVGTRATARRGPRPPRATGRFNEGGTRARCRAVPATIAGAARHGRARGPARSKREVRAHPKPAAPPSNGRRRRRHRQWRTAATRYRAVAELDGDLGRAGEGKGYG